MEGLQDCNLEVLQRCNPMPAGFRISPVWIRPKRDGRIPTAKASEFMGLVEKLGSNIRELRSLLPLFRESIDAAKKNGDASFQQRCPEFFELNLLFFFSLLHSVNSHLRSANLKRVSQVERQLLGSQCLRLDGPIDNRDLPIFGSVSMQSYRFRSKYQSQWGGRGV